MVQLRRQMFSNRATATNFVALGIAIEALAEVGAKFAKLSMRREISIASRDEKSLRTREDRP
jgi:hypothetical protein